MPEIQNPNLAPQGNGGGGGESRGMLSFMFLALLALLGFQFFMKPKASEPAQQQQSQSAPAQTASALPSVSGAPSVVPDAVASGELKTTVANGLYRITFSNRGASATSWLLEDKQYKESPEGKQLDLINAKTTGFGLPLELYTYDSGLDQLLNKAALYQVTTTGNRAADGSLTAPATVSFHYAAKGIEATKTLHFEAQSYVVKVDTEVKRGGNTVRALVTWPAALGDQTDALQFAGSKLVWSADGKEDSAEPKKVSGNATYNEHYDFTAITDLYFAAAFMPDQPATATAVTLHNSMETGESGNAEHKTRVNLLGLAVGSTAGATHLRLYAGPKQLDVLKTIHATGADGRFTGPTLEPLIQFGSILGVIAKPLYLALRFLHNAMGPGEYNWGWSIILFTAVFCLIMLPTRLMAMKSSLKMMRIQPKVEALKRKYQHLKATDPKRAEMNAEMMALYKTEGVNMYGGCLPLLPQIPLFFAYFRVLQNTVELRQAHWFWLHDLSAPDPLYILPVLIIITMFLVQIMTPAPGMDPAQRKMMAFMMPLFMGFVLFHYASGLALYWGTSNIINFLMQLAINRSSIGQEMHALAAKRAAKKSAKTIQGRR